MAHRMKGAIKQASFHPRPLADCEYHPSTAGFPRLADGTPPTRKGLRPWSRERGDGMSTRAASGASRARSVSEAKFRLKTRPDQTTVPSIELVDQTLAKFHYEGIYDVGVMQAQHHRTDSSRPIQIASVQTLMRRDIPPAELVF